MRDRKPARRVVVSVVILLLVLGMTFGMVWHHHADRLTAACPVCHLVIVPLAAAVPAVSTPVAIGTVGEAAYTEPADWSVSRLPARAPPV